MTDKKYYIWDKRSFVGNAVLFWGPNRSGYTTNVDEAGVYSEEEARRIERVRGTDVPVPYALVQGITIKMVDANTLSDALRNHVDKP